MLAKVLLLSTVGAVFGLAAWLVKRGIRVRTWHSLVAFAGSGLSMFLYSQQGLALDPPWDMVLLASVALTFLVGLSLFFAARRSRQ